MTILGIETSCDETAAAVVQDGRKLLSNVVASSLDLHKAYGGVVPEIAARSHLEVVTPVIMQALDDAKLNWDKIDALAVTQGPGLIGSLLIGVMTARTLAVAKQKPLLAVNHVHAHPYAAFLGEEIPKFPFLALIVSGGHTQIVLFESHNKYAVLGQTTDDAVGEAYDKVAKMLGLPYPGGPSVSEAAKNGDPNRYKLPRAKLDNPYDFSFSGPKTAVLRVAQTAAGHDFTFPSASLPKALKQGQKCDIAASFQQSAIDTLIEAMKRAETEFNPKSIVIAGGVAANRELRRQASEQLSTPVIYPDFDLCTDNAAMIASLAYFDPHSADPLSLEPSPSLSM